MCVWGGGVEAHQIYKAVQRVVGTQHLLLSDRPSHSFLVFVTGCYAPALVGPKVLLLEDIQSSVPAAPSLISAPQLGNMSVQGSVLGPLLTDDGLL